MLRPAAAWCTPHLFPAVNHALNVPRYVSAMHIQGTVNARQRHASLFAPAHAVHRSHLFHVAQASRVIAVMPTGKRTSLHRTVTRRRGQAGGHAGIPHSNYVIQQSTQPAVSIAAPTDF